MRPARRRRLRGARPDVRVGRGRRCRRSSTTRCCSRTATSCSRRPAARIAGARSVTLHELDGLDVIEPPVGVSCDVTLSRAWAAAGCTRQTVFRTDDNLTVMRMVGAGVGHALVPELAAEPGLDADVEVVPVQGEGMVRRIAIFWHRDRYRSRAAETFVEIAREVCCADHAARRLTLALA